MNEQILKNIEIDQATMITFGSVTTRAENVYEDPLFTRSASEKC